MSFWHILLHNIRRHRFSTILALISITLGIGLLTAVVSFREQSHHHFITEGVGVDAILGPKGSPLQIAMNAMYHLEEMPGKIKWSYYEKVKKDPLVVDAIPFVTGHSYAGYRVNAIDDRFFTSFEYRPGKRFSFDPDAGGQGRMFKAPHEAVAGWAVAKALGLHLGDTFNPVCGVHSGDPVHMHDKITFVGILAPTGTPHDRAIYIPLKTFYTLEGHGASVAAMATDSSQREISGAYLKLRHIRGGAMHPGVQNLKYEIDQSTEGQLVVPSEVVPRILDIIGWVDKVMFIVGALVTLLAIMFLFVVLITALREQRRELAMMRMLGANRRTVFGLIMSEAVFLSIVGTIFGIVFGHLLVMLGSHYVAIETGMQFSANYLSSADIWVLPCVTLMGAVAGLIPAVQAYRMSILRNLNIME
ncbi:ABC transporter permease [bacterium]|nr:ABC transporter permease [bacterium]